MKQFLRAISASLVMAIIMGLFSLVGSVYATPDTKNQHFEAENGTIIAGSGGGKPTVGNDGATRFVGGFDYSGCGVSFAVNVTDAGVYKLTINAGCYGAGNCKILLNGVVDGIAILPNSNGWTTFVPSIYYIYIPAGNNTLMFQKSDYPGPVSLCFDSFDIAYQGVGNKSEAENGILTAGNPLNNSMNIQGPGDASSSAFSSAGKYVGGIDNSGDTVTLTVNAPKAGKYNLLFVTRLIG